MAFSLVVTAYRPVVSSISRRSVLSALIAMQAVGLSGFSGLAQSGAPEPIAPMKHHDARIGALIETLGEAKTPNAAVISPDRSYVAWTVMSGRDYELHLTGLAPEGAAHRTPLEM
jgi:hypothetical protein